MKSFNQYMNEESDDMSQALMNISSSIEEFNTVLRSYSRSTGDRGSKTKLTGLASQLQKLQRTVDEMVVEIEQS